jgi:hypothetical protein
VTNPAELADALDWAIGRHAPTVVDAIIDRGALPTGFAPTVSR